MTDTPQPNPFTDAAPFRPADLPGGATRRPGVLTAICIVAVVLGVIGLLSGGLKGVNALFGAEMQTAFGSLGTTTPEQARIQKEMQAAIAVEMERFAVANGILSVCQIAFCGVLVYSGLKTLKLKAVGRKLLLATAVCLLGYEIGQLIVFVFQQLSMSPIMELYMPQIMKDSSPNNAGAEKLGQIFARMTIIVGVVMQCAWTLIKFVFYAFAVRYLCKAEVLALMDSSPQPNPS